MFLSFVSLAYNICKKSKIKGKLVVFLQHPSLKFFLQNLKKHRFVKNSFIRSCLSFGNSLFFLRKTSFFNLFKYFLSVCKIFGSSRNSFFLTCNIMSTKILKNIQKRSADNPISAINAKKSLIKYLDSIFFQKII